MNNLHIFVLSELNKYGGGVETWINYFLQNFDLKKIKGNIYVYHKEPRNINDSLIRNFNEERIKFIFTKTNKYGKGSGIKTVIKYTFENIFKNFSNIKKNDLIISIGTTYTAPISIMYKLLKRKKIKLVTWIRSISIGEMKANGSKYYKISKVLEKKLIRYSDFIIANGKDTKEYYQKKYDIVESKISVINNAVDHKKFDDIKIPNFNNKIKIAYLGRLSKAKGFFDLLNAVKNLKSKDRNNLEFNIYGHGENSRFIDENIFNYYGKYTSDEIKKILSKNDIILFLNKAGMAGGVSHGLLEAMASGRLILAYNNIIHNQILDGSDSILAEENEYDLSKKLKLINHHHITKNDLLIKCSNARKKAKKYDIHVHMRNFYKTIKGE